MRNALNSKANEFKIGKDKFYFNERREILGEKIRTTSSLCDGSSELIRKMIFIHYLPTARVLLFDRIKHGNNRISTFNIVRFKILHISTISKTYEKFILEWMLFLDLVLLYFIFSRKLFVLVGSHILTRTIFKFEFLSAQNFNSGIFRCGWRCFGKLLNMFFPEGLFYVTFCFSDC